MTLDARAHAFMQRHVDDGETVSTRNARGHTLTTRSSPVFVQSLSTPATRAFVIRKVPSTGSKSEICKAELKGDAQRTNGVVVCLSTPHM
jgi:hypothetical protein